MRLNIDHIEDFEDFDEIDDFAYERSRALQKLLDGHRREQRAGHHDRQRSRLRGRPEHADWDWNVHDDWNSYDLDDYEDLDLRY